MPHGYGSRLLETFTLLAVIGIFWVRALLRHLATKTWISRRSAAQWAWTFIGAALGSYFGVAGFGTAIPGTALGALLGYLGAGYIMAKAQLGEQVGPSQKDLIAATEVAGRTTGRALAEANLAAMTVKPHAVSALAAIGRTIRRAVQIAVIMGVVFFLLWTFSQQSQHRGASVPLPAPLPKYAPETTLETRPQAPPMRVTAPESTPKTRLQTSPAKDPAVERPARAGFERERRGARTYPDCEYKGVMSDDDYRKCGLQPPGSN
jgi:hypothetical protein